MLGCAWHNISEVERKRKIRQILKRKLGIGKGLGLVLGSSALCSPSLSHCCYCLKSCDLIDLIALDRWMQSRRGCASWPAVTRRTVWLRQWEWEVARGQSEDRELQPKVEQWEGYHPRRQLLSRLEVLISYPQNSTLPLRVGRWTRPPPSPLTIRRGWGAGCGPLSQDRYSRCTQRKEWESKQTTVRLSENRVDQLL